MQRDTGARQELLVFSSLKPKRIDWSRTSAVVVRDLKHFMELLDRGPQAIAGAVYGITGDFESPFEERTHHFCYLGEEQPKPMIN